MSQTPRFFSPPPAECQSESVAAPAEVVQGEGTHLLSHFNRWLDAEAAKASESFDDAQQSGLHRWEFGQRVARCHAASRMVEEFKRGLRA